MMKGGTIPHKQSLMDVNRLALGVKLSGLRKKNKVGIADDLETPKRHIQFAPQKRHREPAPPKRPTDPRPPSGHKPKESVYTRKVSINTVKLNPTPKKKPVKLPEIREHHVSKVTKTSFSVTRPSPWGWSSYDAECYWTCNQPTLVSQRVDMNDHVRWPYYSHHSYIPVPKTKKINVTEL